MEIQTSPQNLSELFHALHRKMLLFFVLCQKTEERYFVGVYILSFETETQLHSRSVPLELLNHEGAVLETDQIRTQLRTQKGVYSGLNWVRRTRISVKKTE